MLPTGGGASPHWVRLSAACSALALLTALPAAPPLGAQTADNHCVPSVTGGSEFVYSGPLTYSGAFTDTPGVSPSDSDIKSAIHCSEIDHEDGVKLTFGGTIGEKDDPVGAIGIEVTTADDAANGAITIINNGEIYADSTNTSDGRGISAYIKNPASTDGLTVTHNGKIVSENYAISAYHDGLGPVTVNTGEDSTMEVKDFGNALTEEFPERGVIYIWIDSDAGGTDGDSTGVTTVNHKGRLLGVTDGIFIEGDGTGDVNVMTGRESAIRVKYKGIYIEAENSAATNKGAVTVTHGGVIAAGGHGIHVEHKGTGRVSVTVSPGASVMSGGTGIYVDGPSLADGRRAQTVTVRGKVTGGDGDSAGVRMSGGGGTVVIGPMAHVGSQSGAAVRIDPAGKLEVILEKGGDGLYGNLDGKVLNDPEMTTFKTRAGSDAGTEETLAAGGMVDMRGETKGVYDEVFRAELMTAADGHEFKKTTFRSYHPRARVYEALPSVLLDLNGQISYHKRMSAPRGDNGAWARVEASDGKRAAAGSTVGKGLSGTALSWDIEHQGVEAGFDIPADEALTLGLSAHTRRGKAAVKGGGGIEASGTGLGLSAAYAGGSGFYVDGRISWTRFSGIGLTSEARGQVASGLSGSGYAVGVEAGRRMVLENMTLTPRGGLVLSSADAGDFDDAPGVAGGGKVSVTKAQSLKGRLGALAETGFGGDAGSGRAFASLDVEREFSPDRSVTASGTELASEEKATWLRLGLGGSLNVAGPGMATLSG